MKELYVLLNLLLTNTWISSIRNSQTVFLWRKFVEQSWNVFLYKREDLLLAKKIVVKIYFLSYEEKKPKWYSSAIMGIKFLDDFLLVYKILRNWNTQKNNSILLSIETNKKYIWERHILLLKICSISPILEFSKLRLKLKPKDQATINDMPF